MPTTILTSTEKQKERTRLPLAQRTGRHLVHRMLARLATGRLTLKEDGRIYHYGRVGRDDSLSARVTVIDPHFYQAAAFGGSIGVAESYMRGDWRCDDLVAVIRIVIRNQQVLQSLDTGWSGLANTMNRGYHWLRKNTQRGSRANIVAHYDLGNDFYRLFLDETMAYSSGIFEDEHASLKDASIAKFDRICRKLELKPGDHLLEIGTGWGGLAIHAAQHYGCRVTTTTISDRQFSYVRQRIETAGLSRRITLLKQDYRDLKGTYDKLVSVEMIEAVGHHYLNKFFQICSRRLKPGGRMLLQAITINDQAYDEHKRSVDFIKRYIFPGSCLTSVTAMAESLTRHTDMRIYHLEDITAHYATTLNRWRKRFWRHIEKVRCMGFSEIFIRMWHYYLCYCEAAFLERYIGDVQMLLTKPKIADHR